MSRKIEFTPRFFRPPADHYFLLGPRGTGKTWWTQRHYPQALRVDLLDPETMRSLSARPERLLELIAARQDAPQVVIDEVQKLPELLEVAHLLIEERRGAQFIFTGSSARKLRRSGVNLLGGRAAQKSLHPYMAAELGERFQMEEALRLGMLPMVHGAREPAVILRAYNGLYLREEVQMEGLVRNVGSFARFLEAISFSHGAVLNLANVARECQVNHKMVEGYLEILEDLLLAFRIPVFMRRAKRELAAHPKFFFSTPGSFAPTALLAHSILRQKSTALHSKVWSPNTCAPGAIIQTATTACSIGRHGRRWKSISLYTAGVIFTHWK